MILDENEMKEAGCADSDDRTLAGNAVHMIGNVMNVMVNLKEITNILKSGLYTREAIPL